MLPMVQQEAAPVELTDAAQRLEEAPVWEFKGTPMSGGSLRFRPVKMGGEDLVGLREDARTAGVHPVPKQFRATADKAHWVERNFLEAVGKDGEPIRVETQMR